MSRALGDVIAHKEVAGLLVAGVFLQSEYVYDTLSVNEM